MLSTLQFSHPSCGLHVTHHNRYSRSRRSKKNHQSFVTLYNWAETKIEQCDSPISSFIWRCIQCVWTALIILLLQYIDAYLGTHSSAGLIKLNDCFNQNPKNLPLTTTRARDKSKRAWRLRRSEIDIHLIQNFHVRERHSYSMPHQKKLLSVTQHPKS